MQQEISKWQMSKAPQGHKVMVKMSNITFDEMLPSHHNANIYKRNN